MRAICDLVGLALLVLFTVWIVLVLLVAPDRKPVVTCAPLHYSLGVAQRLLRAGTTSDLIATPAPGKRDAGDQVTLACVAYVDRYVRAADGDSR